MKQIVYISLLIFMFESSVFTAESVKNVLVLNSYHEGFSWTDGVTASIKKYFSGSQTKVELYFEYLDRKRFADKAYINMLPGFFLKKYQDLQISVIIAVDDNALSFLRENEKSLFPSIPVVYAGINDLSIPDVVNGKRYTGILEETPPDKTINLALTLHPGVKHIYVLADYASTGRARIKSLEMVRGNFPDISFEYSANTTMDKIKQRLSSLDKSSLVLLLAFFNDSTGTYFSYEKLMSEIQPVTAVPVYAVSANLLGLGITGGVVNSSETQGVEAARITEMIIEGKKPRDIQAKRDVELKVVLDYKEMKRFGIAASSLPFDSMVINKPRGFYDFYQENMVLFLMLISVSFLVVILVMAAGSYKILKINRERLAVISRLSNALEEVKALQGLLPICSNCKNVRNDEGYWEQIETYVSDHSRATFTHSLCPNCAKKLYPELDNERDPK